MKKNGNRIAGSSQTANERLRYYSLTTRIGQSPVVNFTGLPEDSGLETQLNSPTGSDLVRRLFAITGVQNVAVEPYAVAVEIGRAFRWEEIEGHIMDALVKCFDPNQKVEVVWP